MSAPYAGLAVVSCCVDRNDIRGSCRLHMRTALEDHTLLDRERWGRDVAVDLCRTAQFDGLRRLDVPDDLTLDDYCAAADPGPDLRPLPHLPQIVPPALPGDA